MRKINNLAKFAIVAAVGAGVAGWLWQASRSRKTAGNQAFTVAVNVPELSGPAIEGKTAFDKVCAACHGKNAAGTDKGPPLVHDIYNPGHHADEAFVIAARFGVRQHHWPYGNMPAQPDVTDEQIVAIIRYVRELQAANGIKARPHVM